MRLWRASEQAKPHRRRLDQLPDGSLSGRRLGERRKESKGQGQWEGKRRRPKVAVSNHRLHPWSSSGRALGRAGAEAPRTRSRTWAGEEERWSSWVSSWFLWRVWFGVLKEIGEQEEDLLHNRNIQRVDPLLTFPAHPYQPSRFELGEVVRDGSRLDFE